MELFIGNRNYSSWSMRPGVLPKQFGIACEEKLIRFDSFTADSQFARTIRAISPVGKVPVLRDGNLVVWDTLAIAEYWAERFPDKHLWPQAVAARARARSICAEMHSGFGALRSACPMNIEASLLHIGALVLRDQVAVRADIARIEQMWEALLEEHGGPYLFGKAFTIADAYFTPVCMRIKTYGLSQKPHVQSYIAAVSAAPGVKAWIDTALLEKDFVIEDEPYRLNSQ